MRRHNFNAGPSALPLEVLTKAREELFDFEGEGISVLEMSHRSDAFLRIMHRAKTALTELLQLSEEYEVLFLHGGATLQFSMVAQNLGPNGAYALTGVFAEKAYEEACRLSKATIAYSDKQNGYRKVPDKSTPLELAKDCAYLHVTTNNTIVGTQYHEYPDVQVPLVADMSSDFLSRPIDISQFGLVYAGAQKNAGTAGVTYVLIKKSLVSRDSKLDKVPLLLRYDTHVDASSLYNTANTFSVYVSMLVLEWIQQQGGLSAMAQRNAEKAQLIYRVIDAYPHMFEGHAEKSSRSLMNITFRFQKPELEKMFLKECKEAGCIGLSGHRLTGGIRVSIYNAVSVESCRLLSSLMETFAQTR